LSIKSAATTNGEKGKLASNALLEIFKSNPSIEAKFQNFEAFLTRVSKARIVYAFGEKERLARESELGTEIGIEDIRDKLAEENVRPAVVYEVLQEAGYLDRNGHITSKLLISTSYIFNLDCTLFGTVAETNELFYNQIVKHFQSGYNGIMLKLEFQRIKRCLNEAALEFMLCAMDEELSLDD